ncbi:histidinol phosphate aminotransferase apoenzyme [Sulfobacillus thermosulfidooxidans DSM 9293]|uniref:Histidinol-phosphate aminotransferase n=1 Tax=Sulfobacillus thermosulfidooxidans (strain DSM 9293 / VKM B-1269 / AT-1) TaxID=929705 RepID=A0A1W1W9A6_SULTA|nr:histidinol-phosphate transaminase [Sulfobacillus thermosulfidooxidans]SMC02323.1 histidinol phosphate aminotransferase apoenzyme [Sulfobacillus thermosulfidooxidans DSM 9293]
MIQPKTSLLTLTPYVPGRSIESVYQDTGIEAIKLASNESLWGPSPKAIDAAKKALNHLSLYPEAHLSEVYELLADLSGLSADHIIAGNGADELLQLIALTFAGPGDEIIFPAPSFSAYRHGTLLTGATPVVIPLNAQGAPDLQEALAHVSAKTRIIFLCSPNNPTGGILHQDEWNAFLAHVPPSVLVVVDQAYFEFVEDPHYAQLREDILAGRPVIMVRTLSKIYALAALRIGWAAAPLPIIQSLRTVRQPFSVNRVAYMAAQGALTDQKYVAKVRQETVAARAFMADQFSQRGYSFWPSHANFMTIDLHDDAEKWARQLEMMGYVTRPATSFGLPHHLRVTVAPIPILEGFFNAFDRVRER